MGVMLSAAGSLAWLGAAVAPHEPLETLVAEAERWPPGVEGLTFSPYLAGERTPHVDPHARGAFVGLSLRHDRGALVRAVLEGVAFGLRDSLELVRLMGSGLRLPGSPAVGRAATSGSGSLPPCSRSRSSGTAVDEGVRLWRRAPRWRRRRRRRRRPRGCLRHGARDGHDRAGGRVDRAVRCGLRQVSLALSSTPALRTHDFGGRKGGRT